MSNIKSLGNEGIAKLFYKTFWEDLKDVLAAGINRVLT